MRGITVTILLGLVAQADAREPSGSMDKPVDVLVDRLFEQAFELLPLQQASPHHLGKPGYLDGSPCNKLVASAGLRRGCNTADGILCGQGCEDGQQMRHSTAQLPNRRHAALVASLGALAAVARPSHAEVPEGFKQGEAGISFKDITVGTGKEYPDESLETKYDLKNANTGEQFNTFQLSTVVTGYGGIIKRLQERAIKGGGVLPKMKQGGKRTVIIPSDIAWGSTGALGIPPNTDLELTVEVVNKGFFR